MYGARTMCCDLAMATCTSCIVALKAQFLAKRTYSERLSTLSGVKAFVEALVVACYRSVL